MQREELANDRRVRAPGEVQPGGAVGNAKFRGAYLGKRPLSSAAADDESAVDVEQYESDHKSRANYRYAMMMATLMSGNAGRLITGNA